jgi:integrase
MKSKYHRTKCTVKLKKSPYNKGEFYLLVESYPVFTEKSKVAQRLYTSLNRTITTPIWDKDRPTRGGQHLPRRNTEGIIQCRSDADKEACKFAHKYCQMQQSEYDNQALYPELYKQKKEADRKADTDFIEYLRNLIKRRSVDVGESINSQWNLMLKRIEDFAQGKPIRFGDLTPQWLEGFRNYLITKKSENGKTLSPNSQKLYLTHFKTVLINAYKDEILTTDLSKKLQPIRGEETQRTHLTIEELQTLANTSFKYDEIRRAALFSALTGLRHSDIKKLTWGEITGDKTKEPRIEFRQKKTKGVLYLPMSSQALALCGKRQKDDEEKVFPELLKTEHINPPIREWVAKAGIEKHITFHCFRHTYATLQIASGTDIYVVSKLLGHTNVVTTQKYAKVVDSKKQKAANAIKLNLNHKKTEN